MKLLAVVVLLSWAALRAQTSRPGLGVLRTVRAAHVLSNAEAARHYAVDLARAQVTVFLPGVGGFLQDATDGIYMRAPADPRQTFRAGDIVHVRGITAPGDLVPVIDKPQLRLLGHAPLPPAPLVSFDHLTTGAYDSKLVTLEGIVRSIAPFPDAVAPTSPDQVTDPQCIVTLASGQEQVAIWASSAEGCARRDLVDAKVRLKVVAASWFNPRKQLIGIRMFMQDFSSLAIEEPAPADPFRLPVTDTAGVMRLGERDPGHRVHVRGVVTATWGEQQFSLMDESYGIFVRTDAPARIRVGDLVDVVAFPSWGDYTSVLEDAIFRRIGVAHVPEPAVVTAAAALAGGHDAEPIRLEGQLLYRSRSPSEEDLLLSEQGTTFTAALPASVREGFPADLEPGSLLQVTGICHIDVNPDKTPKALTVLLQSPAAIVVLRSPSWWTVSHTALVLGALLAVVFVVVGWNVVLRRRVRVQTGVIQQQLDEAQALRREAEAATYEQSQSLANVLSLQRDLLNAQEELRFQATHDVLTGLWNRRALLDRMHQELERTLRTRSSMGILLLDLDHFKEVNDTYGHLTGDEALKEIAQRILRATRPYDVTGRYGGEEFLVILPGCDRQETVGSAERIRAAIFDSPILLTGARVALTVSIGATVAPDCVGWETEILSTADAALYEAKSAGRNRTVMRQTLQEDLIAGLRLRGREGPGSQEIPGTDLIDGPGASSDGLSTE